MRQVELINKRWCEVGKFAKALLDKKGIEYQEFDVTDDAELEQQLIEWSGVYTVPQIFVNGTLVGGWEELVAAERSGQLDQALAPAEDA